jgi:hypothetical protein
MDAAVDGDDSVQRRRQALLAKLKEPGGEGVLCVPGRFRYGTDGRVTAPGSWCVVATDQQQHVGSFSKDASGTVRVKPTEPEAGYGWKNEVKLCALS